MNHVAAHSGSWDASPLRGEPPHILGVSHKNQRKVIFMNQQVVLEITNAENRIKSINERTKRFLEHLQKHSKPQGLPSSVMVGNQTIAVECYGQSFSAEPRVVTDGQGMFAVEFIFYARRNEESEELWRFYLTDSGSDRTPEPEPRLMWEVEHIRPLPARTRRAVFCPTNGVV